MRSPLSKPLVLGQSGFTLIELMVTVAIMLVLLVFGLVNYLRVLDKQRLYQTGSSIESMLKDARAKAQNGFLGSEEVGFCSQLRGVEVVTSSSNGQQQLLGRLRCLDDTLLVYHSYLIENLTIGFEQDFTVTFLPRRGAKLLVAGTETSSASLTLVNDVASVRFDLDQGGAIDVSYE